MCLLQPPALSPSPVRPVMRSSSDPMGMGSSSKEKPPWLCLGACLAVWLLQVQGPASSQHLQICERRMGQDLVMVARDSRCHGHGAGWPLGTPAVRCEE